MTTQHDMTIRTLPAARIAGRTWAEDRQLTGSTWSQFRLEDALGAVAAELPDERRRRLAHEICRAAAERWSTR